MSLIEGQASMTRVWSNLLYRILSTGCEVSPRGMKTLEILQHTIRVNMRKPVLLEPERRLSYKFMAAEAFWILSGDNRVETIAPYNKNIAKFSDDGVTYFGAYGPKITEQLNYVVTKLLEDGDTRQAGLTIWRENPPPTKDVPCTVAIFFNIRLGKLNAHVFMRSSDAWLGVPYDVFNFSMLAHLVCAHYNERRRYMTFEETEVANIDPQIIATQGIPRVPCVTPGALHLTMASSHLYEQHFEAAKTIVVNNNLNPESNEPDTSPAMYTQPKYIMDLLEALRDSSPGDLMRWWEVK